MICSSRMALASAKLSDFRLGGRLGDGSSARVYEGVHIATGRPVAIKVVADHALLEGQEVRERFAREALLLAGVESRYVNKILGFGFERGRPFLVLDRLRGETLDAKLRRDGAVPPLIAARWTEQLISGVRDCHAAQILHRDIKPSNLFLHREHGREHEGREHQGREHERAEVLTLIDFGVARLMQLAGDTDLTSPGDLIGSMGYMAPEQFERAQAVGWPADLYAVGVVVFRMFTGRLPFVSRSLEAAIRMKLAEPVPLVSSVSQMRSAALDAFVLKATARDPAARFQSAREMLEDWSTVVPALEDAVDHAVTTVRVGPGDASEGAGTLASAHDVSLPESSEVPTLSRRAASAAQPGAVREQAPRAAASQGVGRADTGSRRARPPSPSDSDPFELETRNDPDLGRRIRHEIEQLERDARRGRE